MASIPAGSIRQASQNQRDGRSHTGLDSCGSYWKLLSNSRSWHVVRRDKDLPIQRCVRNGEMWLQIQIPSCWKELMPALHVHRVCPEDVDLGRAVSSVSHQGGGSAVGGQVEILNSEVKDKVQSVVVVHVCILPVYRLGASAAHVHCDIGIAQMRHFWRETSGVEIPGCQHCNGQYPARRQIDLIRAIARFDINPDCRMIRTGHFLSVHGWHISQEPNWKCQ